VNKKKPKHLKNKIIIIDASKEYKEGKNQNTIEDEHIDKVVKAYDAEKDIERFMRVVDLAELAENDYNLNITRYIDNHEMVDDIDLKVVLGNISTLKAKEIDIDKRLSQYLKELGL